MLYIPSELAHANLKGLQEGGPRGVGNLVMPNAAKSSLQLLVPTSLNYMGLYWGYIRDILGLCWDNGKQNGNYYLGFIRPTRS